MKVHKTGGVFSECVNPIRLHAEQYHIKIIDCDERYIKQISKGNPKINIDGNEIMCYRNSLEVYSNTPFLEILHKKQMLRQCNIGLVS